MYSRIKLIYLYTITLCFRQVIPLFEILGSWLLWWHICYDVTWMQNRKWLKKLSVWPVASIFDKTELIYMHDIWHLSTEPNNPNHVFSLQQRQFNNDWRHWFRLTTSSNCSLECWKSWSEVCNYWSKYACYLWSMLSCWPMERMSSTFRHCHCAASCSCLCTSKLQGDSPCSGRRKRNP